MIVNNPREVKLESPGEKPQPLRHGIETMRIGFWREEKALGKKRSFFISLLALGLHVGLWYGLQFIDNKTKKPWETANNGIKVRFEKPPEKTQNEIKTKPPETVETAPNQSNVTKKNIKTAESTKSPRKDNNETLSRVDSSPVQQAKEPGFVDPAPVMPKTAENSQPVPQNPETLDNPTSSPETQTSVSRKLKDFLPGSSKSYTETQREQAKTIGEGPIGGDISDDEKADPTKKIVEKEYPLAAYFDGLSRLFNDAWGPIRTIPQDAFYGKVGEKIQYDVIINRDGTLRKIVNVSARLQPHRDFHAVDQLVFDVFKSVFPYNPIPDRVVQQPLVLRKVIVFQGYGSSIF